MSSVTIDFVLPKLHPKQKYIIAHAKRFNHLRCGRRFGKTTLIEELSSISLDGKYVGIWFPTYKDLSEVWNTLKNTYHSVIFRKDETLKQIHLMTAGRVDFWSMENPDSGQGFKYHRAIIDESAKAGPNLWKAWENTIRPTLTDYRGDAYIMSRPKGKTNSFYDIEQKHRQFSNWAFFHFTTYDNPHIDPSEVDEAKVQLDTITFQQEYLAEYVDANDKPYLYAFEEVKHTIDEFEVNPHLPILISWDFNVNPMTAILGQQSNLHTLTIFDEFNIEEGSVYEVCEVIEAKYPKLLHNLEITGDASGQARSVLTKGNLNAYRIIKTHFNLPDRAMRVPKVNLAHKDSRVLCNSVLQNANLRITKNCKLTIQDAIRAAVDDKGELIKDQAHGMHKFDAMRYAIHATFKDFISNPSKYK